MTAQGLCKASRCDGEICYFSQDLHLTTWQLVICSTAPDRRRLTEPQSCLTRSQQAVACQHATQRERTPQNVKTQGVTRGQPCLGNCRRDIFAEDAARVREREGSLDLPRRVGAPQASALSILIPLSLSFLKERPRATVGFHSLVRRCMCDCSALCMWPVCRLREIAGGRLILQGAHSFRAA